MFQISHCIWLSSKILFLYIFFKIQRKMHMGKFILFWPWPSIWPWLHYFFHFCLVSETVLFNNFSRQFQKTMHKGKNAQGKIKNNFITFWPWSKLFHARSLWSLTCLKLADPNFYINLHFLYISHHGLPRQLCQTL